MQTKHASQEQLDQFVAVLGSHLNSVGISTVNLAGVLLLLGADYRAIPEHCYETLVDIDPNSRASSQTLH